MPPTTSCFTSSLSHLSHPISFLALSAPFLYAAAGPQVHVIDSSSLTHLHSFPPSSSSGAAVKSISFTNGRFVITAHQDGKIRVWLQPDRAPSQSHRLVTVLPTTPDRLQRFVLPRIYVQVRRHKKRLWIHHNDAVSALAVNSNTDQDQLVYSVSWDKCLKIWGGSDFKCIESVTAHEDAVNAVAVSTAGVVFTGSADGRIRVWAKQQGEKSSSKHILLATLEKHKSAVNALALMISSSSSSSSTVLFSGACDRSILVWEREDAGSYMVVVGALRGHQRAVLCLITVRDVLFSGSADRTVRMWRRNLLDQKFCCLVVLDGHLATTMTASNEEGTNSQNAEFAVYSGSLDGEIRLWQGKVSSL